MRQFVAGIVVGLVFAGAYAAAHDEVNEDAREVIAKATREGVKVFNPRMGSLVLRNAFGWNDQVVVAHDGAGMAVMAAAIDPDGRAAAIKVDREGRVICSPPEP